MRSKIKYDIIKYNRQHNTLTISYKDTRYALEYYLKRYDTISKLFETGFTEEYPLGSNCRNTMYTASLELNLGRKARNYA